MKLLPHLRIRFLPKLHGEGPTPLGEHEGQLQVALVRLRIQHVRLGDVPLLEMPPIALRYLQHLPQPGDAPGAIAAIPLVIAMA